MVATALVVGSAISDTSLGFFLSGAAISPEKLVLLIDKWDRFRAKVLSYPSKYNLILAPVNAYHRMSHSESLDNILGFSYTITFNLTGWPAGVMRAGTSKDGLPVGIQIAAHPWREDIVLAALSLVEQTIGGWKHSPI